VIQFGNVSKFGAMYPDKDCSLFFEDLVPGEGLHHVLMYSLLAVFHGSRQTELHLFLIREWGVWIKHVFNIITLDSGDHACVYRFRSGGVVTA
jgi:hypothetical protein